MSGNDWLFIICVAGFVVLIFALDGIRRFDNREAERAEEEDRHRFLMDEVRKQP